MDRHAGDVPSSPGWVYVKTFDDETSRWNPEGFVSKSAAYEEPRAKGSDESKKRARAKRAVAEWNRAGAESTSHERIVRYFASRGIDVSQLSGGAVPNTIRYLDDCKDTWNPDLGESGGWNCSPAILFKQVGADGKFESVQRIFLDPDGDGKRPPELGDAKKMLGPSEGKHVEISRAYKSGVLTVCEGLEVAACLSIALKAKSAVWSCVDANGLMQLRLSGERFAPNQKNGIHTIIVAGDLDRSEAGNKAAMICANSLRAQRPWITVVVKLPSVLELPDAVEGEGSAARPVDNAKSVDWHDVFCDAGPKAVVDGLFRAVDLEASFARAFGWSDEQASSTIETPEGERSDDERFITESPLGRAQKYLLDRYSGSVAERAGKRFRLARYRRQWYEWTGTHYKLRQDELVHAAMLHYLDGHVTEKRKDIVPLCPKPADASDAVKAMHVDTIVAEDMLPAWLPASFKADGAPMFGVASRESHRAKSGKPVASMLGSFTNCLLDLEPLWKRREVVPYEHDPRYFCTTALPYALDLDALEACLADESKLPEVMARLCPNAAKFLGEAFDNEADVMCAQEIVGYLMAPITSLQRVFLVQGLGGSGKGILQTIIGTCVGTENIGPTSFDKIAIRFHPSTLRDKLVAMMYDAKAGRFTDMDQSVDFIKQVSGEDLVQIEWKGNNDTISMKLPCRFVIFVNDMPEFNDDSGAFVDRLVVLPMPRSMRSSKVRNDELKARVGGEGPGLAIWALLGLVRLMERVAARTAAIDAGKVPSVDEYLFTKAKRYDDVTRDLRRSSSWIRSFFEDCLSTESLADDAKPSQPCAEVHLATIGWCEDQNQPSVSKQLLTTKLRSVVPDIETKQPTTGDRSARHYVGVRLNAAGLEMLELGRKVIDRRRGDGGDASTTPDEGLPVASDAGQAESSTEQAVAGGDVWDQTSS